jgi:hypothetical protein
MIFCISCLSVLQPLILPIFSGVQSALNFLGWRRGSVVEHMLSLLKDLDLISSAKQLKNKKTFGFQSWEDLLWLLVCLVFFVIN